MALYKHALGAELREIFRKKNELFNYLEHNTIERGKTCMAPFDIKHFIEIYGKQIFGFCFHLCGDTDRAQELYQETMLKLLEKKNNSIGKTGSDEDYKGIRNYCMEIALRTHKSMRRKWIKQQSELMYDEAYLETIPSDHAPEEEYISRDEALRLRKLVYKLPEKKKKVILMYYYAQMNIREIADTLHIPEGTVKSRLNSAKEHLRKQMED